MILLNLKKSWAYPKLHKPHLATMGGETDSYWGHVVGCDGWLRGRGGFDPMEKQLSQEYGD